MNRSILYLYCLSFSLLLNTAGAQLLIKNQTLSWMAETNVTYSIQSTFDLSSDTWSPCGSPLIGQEAPAEQSIELICATNQHMHAFFKLDIRFPDAQQAFYPDFLTPEYYTSTTNDLFHTTLNRFVYYAQKSPFHHPLQAPDGSIPSFTIPTGGRFGAEKGTTGTSQHHPASDLHIGNRETQVNLYAAYDGRTTTFRDADKYRHYIALTAPVETIDGETIGTIVTLYAHIDLDLDEADGLWLHEQTVKKGDLISQNLYADTVGGPHLHFETRYYRPSDAATESFYGIFGPDLTAPSESPWLYGRWNPTVGYGYGAPQNHGLAFP